MSQAIFKFFILATMTAACGSGSNNTGEGTPAPNGTELSDPSGNQMDCLKAWSSYVAAHPKGLKTRYEYRTSGVTTFVTYSVTSSSDASVTIVTSPQGSSSSDTTTKSEFLESCKTGAGESSLPVNSVIEARRKEAKTVRAGTFATNYIRARTTVESNSPQITSVSEVWTTDDSLQILVYQKSSVTTGGTTNYSSSELIALERP